ncbi:hypothetical protein AcidC75_33470 [Acidisoma sp. C75]
MKMGAVKAAWRALPEVDLTALLRGRRPLVLAPHPDDESLGCGGLLAQCAAAGITAQVAVLTDGSRSHPGSQTHPPARVAALRRREAAAALAALGLTPAQLHWIGVADCALSAETAEGQAVLRRLAALCDWHGCSLILAPWLLDPHCDHAAAAAIGADLARHQNAGLLFYPVWGWMRPDEEEQPLAPPSGVRLHTGAALAAKRRAIAAHASQHGQVITDAAEGFALPQELLDHCLQPAETFLFP